MLHHLLLALKEPATLKTSWGGAVVAQVSHKHQVGGSNPPPAILILS